MTRLKYKGLRLQTRERQSVSATQVVSRARRLSRQGKYKDAYESVMWLVNEAAAAGLSDIASALLADLRNIVPVQRLTAQDRAWFHNAVGLSESHRSQHRKATRTFTHMLRIGERTGNRQLRSVALQNLGIQATYLGRSDIARKHYTESARLKLLTNDSHGQAQVLINAASLELSEENVTRADEICRDLIRIGCVRRDPHLASSVQGILARVHAKRREFAQAEKRYRNALRMAKRSGDLSAQATVLQNMGSFFMEQDLPKAALPWYRKALELAQQTGLLSLMEDVHSGLAVALHKAGRNSEAASQLEEARRHALRKRNLDAVARYTADLGALAVLMHDPSRAIPLLKRAILRFTRTADQDWRARSTANLAEAQMLSGDRAGARETFKQALSEMPTGNHVKRAELLRRLAEACFGEPGGSVQALPLMRRSLEEFKHFQDKPSYAWQCAAAGAAFSMAGAWHASLGFFDRALQVYRNLGTPEMGFHVRNDRAVALANLGRLDESEREYGLCVIQAKKLRNRLMLVQALSNRAEVLTRMNRLADGIRLFGLALRLAQRIGEQRAEAQALGGLGIACARFERWNDARQVFRHARTLAHRIGDRNSEATALGGLASVDFAKARYLPALRQYKLASALWEAEGDQIHLLEDLAGVTESLAALGRLQSLKVEAERLVRIAQSVGADRDASRTLIRSGQRLLQKGKPEDAARVFAAGILLGGTNEPLFGKMVRGIAEGVAVVAIHVEMHLRKEHHAIFYQKLGQAIAKQSKSLARALKTTIAIARKEARTRVGLERAAGSVDSATESSMKCKGICIAPPVGGAIQIPGAISPGTRREARSATPPVVPARPLRRDLQDLRCKLQTLRSTLKKTGPREDVSNPALAAQYQVLLPFRMSTDIPSLRSFNAVLSEILRLLGEGLTVDRTTGVVKGIYLSSDVRSEVLNLVESLMKAFDAPEARRRPVPRRGGPPRRACRASVSSPGIRSESPLAPSSVRRSRHRP